jgi:hypothetical protein
MNYRDYIKDGKLILPEGFNSDLYCSNNNLTKLILPKGFNNSLRCWGNQLTQLILPEGFNSYLNCDEIVKNEWLSIERERKIKSILDEL